MGRAQDGKLSTFETVRGDGDTPVVLSCEHASGFIPDEFEKLGMSDTHLEECAHGQDVGAADLFDFLVAQLGCAAIRNGVSRLVVDVNRYADQPGVIPTRWGGKEIPGNLDLDDRERSDRIARFHRPYHEALQALLDAAEGRFGRVLYLSIHAMAPTFEGQRRRMDFALIANAGVALADRLAETLRSRGYVATVNEPYRLERDLVRVTPGHAAERFNARAVLIEMNERLCGRAGPRRDLLAAIRELAGALT